MINKIKNIWLTGGTGMVGRNILEQNQSSNFNFYCPTRKELDLTDYKLVCDYVKKIKPDLVINCAAHVGGIDANTEYMKVVSFNNIDHFSVEERPALLTGV